MEATLRILSPSSADDLSAHAPAYRAAAARAALTEHVLSVSNAIIHKPSVDVAHNPILLLLVTEA